MAITGSQFDFVRDLVRTRAAIVLEPGKEYLVESRLGQVARREGFASLGQFLTALQTRPTNGMHHRVVEAMTTNETSFFRDAHPFEALKRSLLPELLAARAAERQLTIWCAACSSGQEPYSIAMLLREYGAALDGWRIRIIATDIATDVLDRARAGRYSQLEVNRGLPAPLLVRYFRKQGVEWQVAEEIRRMVEFQELNLIEPWLGLPTADVVFLRNVLIYFDVTAKREILGRVRRQLRPGGYLLLGGAETTINLDDAYERVPVDRTVCYRTPKR